MHLKGLFDLVACLLPQCSDWSKTLLKTLKPKILLGNDTPHDYVSWSKTPSFSGVQDKFWVLLTTKRGRFGPQNIVMWGIISQ